MNIELSKFRVKDGMSDKVDEWLTFLNRHMDQVLLTLDDEKMYVESIFREKTDQGEFLYWFSIQGEGGTEIEQSAHDVDRKHLDYWYECIDEQREPEPITTEVVMIPDRVRNAMK